MSTLCAVPAASMPGHPSIPAVFDSDAAAGTQAPVIQEWLAPVLDQIDYGLVVLGASMRVLHINASAHGELRHGSHALQLLGNCLAARAPADAAALAQAVEAAVTRQIRRLLAVGSARQRMTVAVVPVRLARRDAALLVLERRAVCSQLSIQCFGRAHDLTLTESRVLALVCEGRSPQQIAQIQGVALSTVRTQLSSVRAKTGVASLRDLVRCIAALPPLVSVLPVGATPA
ncbi:helix-turn-helix domain-containing protein [Aquincola sp. S2]|uniref:Helix-turn-helix domain-containing protein n=1 Tax=Pseudaquabacterium terrae TaxID=2732868 RepID=A0ABX2EBP9_9BURK|nr:helix-turn-helix domain-containing protein [Aquabacterium terrae]NRF65966.1 helix-turn-helix domain-containing protein [Aquabacterium terrae]